MKRVCAIWLSGCLLAVTAGAAAARTAEDVHKTAEASMVVTGTVEVNPNGSLHGYVLDQPDKLPPVVVGVVDKTMPTLEFQLSRPATEVVKTRMSLRVLATPEGGGNFKVSIEGASFGEPGAHDDQVSMKDRSRTPTYPKTAIDARVSGTVYLALRIGRDGTVMDAIAEQVNLDQYDRDASMDRYRKMLADASLDAARHWTFNPPTKGADVDNPYWVARIPVNFDLRMWGAPAKGHSYGQWTAYIPGPRETPPWMSKTLANESPDAVSGDELRTGDARLKLLTPLGGA